ncbi:MAG TPA: hypothetical protein VGL86_02050 [Polyangia bacterium]|jgi:hypothetical protein
MMRIAIETDVSRALAELWRTLWPVDQLILGVSLSQHSWRRLNN